MVTSLTFLNGFYYATSIEIDPTQYFDSSSAIHCYSVKDVKDSLQLVEEHEPFQFKSSVNGVCTLWGRHLVVGVNREIHVLEQAPGGKLISRCMVNAESPI